MQQKKLTQNLNKIFKEYNIYLYIFFISFFSFFITILYGFRGIFPIDSFLIYDSGFKVLNGYHPFKDYWSITGPILDYFQYIYFEIFGVNWLSYVLHSSSINLILSLTLFFFFLKLGLKKIYSFIYAISVSILGYPTAGTPFMDHHATIFSLIAVMLLILSIKRSQNLLWFFIPVVLTVSFLSKQIPAAYLLISFALIIFTNIFLTSYKDIKSYYYIIYGGLFSIFAVALFFLYNDIPFKNFFIQYLLYPLEIGNNRSSKINLDLNNLVLQFKFIYFALLPLILIIFKNINKWKKNLNSKKDLLIIISTIFLIFVFIYCQILTKNQILIFFLIPFCLGISQYYSLRYYNKKFLSFFLIFILVTTTVKFHLRFNENKKFMELNNVDMKFAVNAEKLDTSLDGLLWITPNFPSDPSGEIKKLNELKKILIFDKSKKIVLSDYQILPSISNIEQVAPNKWFDILSVPPKESEFFLEYKKFFLKSLKKQKIETIYFTNDKEIYLKDILQNCEQKYKINEISYKLNIKNCLN